MRGIVNAAAHLTTTLLAGGPRETRLAYSTFGSCAPGAEATSLSAAVRYALLLRWFRLLFLHFCVGRIFWKAEVHT